MIDRSIFEEVSKELDVPVHLVENVYNSYYRFIKQTIEKLPLKTIPLDEFSKLRVNFNLPCIGKLTCQEDKFKYTRNIYKKKQHVRDKDNKDGSPYIQQNHHDSK